MARFYQDFYVADSTGKFLEKATNAYLTVDEGRAESKKLWVKWSMKGYQGHLACSVWKGKNTVECFDGKAFSQHVSTNNKGTVTCPPGSVWDGTKCKQTFPFSVPSKATRKLSRPHPVPVVAGLGVPSPYANMTPVRNTVRWLGDAPVVPDNYYKGLLLAWSKSVDALSMTPKLPFDDYGNPLLDDPLFWKCSRDGRMLTAFSKWWGPKHPGKLTSAESTTVPGCAGMYVTVLDQSHKDALQSWSTGEWPTQNTQPAASPCPPLTKLVAGMCVPDVLADCPAGQFKNPLTGKCEPIPTLPPGFIQPTTPMPSTTPPAAAINCLALCEKNFGATSGKLDPVQLANCIATCGQQATKPGGGDVPPISPGVTDCDAKNPCPAGQICVNGKCQPKLPPPPPPGTTTTSSSSNVGLWVLGGLAAAGAAFLAFRKKSLLENSAYASRSHLRAMTKVEAKRQFETYVLPGIIARYGQNDRPAKGQAWSEWIDSLHRDGRITDRQAQEWDNPYYK